MGAKVKISEKLRESVSTLIMRFSAGPDSESPRSMRFYRPEHVVVVKTAFGKSRCGVPGWPIVHRKVLSRSGLRRE
jgi:hypothetical protein